jgi:hypothetical protein
VLVADARRLEWKGRPDQELKAVVIAAIQQVTVRQRAAAAGVRPDTLAALLAPCPSPASNSARWQDAAQGMRPPSGW